MDVLRESIKGHEGYRERVYLDTEGNPTGGYGHHFAVGSRLPRQVAELLLDSDLADAASEFLKLAPKLIKRLNNPRRRVIMEMIFNMGLPRVLGFQLMWKAIEREDWEEAAREMLDSRWAVQVGDGPGGKKDRAEELAEIMRCGGG